VYRSVRQTLYHVLLWLIAIFFFLPILWIILGAFKTKAELLSIPPKWIFTPTLNNIADLFVRQNVPTYLLTSVIISAAAVIVAIVVSYLAAYSFSRFSSPSVWYRLPPPLFRSI
jgi:multiple sugar transport system permease protein